jgi:hypothetical protein
MITGRGSWVPALAALGRDDDHRNEAASAALVGPIPVFSCFFRFGAVAVRDGRGSAIHPSLTLARHRVRTRDSNGRIRHYGFTCQTAQLIPAPALLRPGLCLFASPTRMRGGRSAERCSGVCETPVGVHVTRHARRLARRPASHDAGRSPLGAPPWRFSARGSALFSHRHLPPLTLRQASGSVSASSSQPGRSA